MRVRVCVCVFCSSRCAAAARDNNGDDDDDNEPTKNKTKQNTMMLSATRVFRTALLLPLQNQSRRSFATKVSAAMVKELRQVTGAPMMECKTALSHEDVAGDMDKAVEWLRKNGVQTAEKKSGRETKAGLVGTLISPDSGAAAIVELNSETDFVAKNENFLAAVETILGATLDAAELVSGSSNGVDAAALLDVSVSGEDGDVRGVITRAVATMRENIELNRAARLSFDPASEVVGSYVHNGGGSNYGTSAAIVQLRSSGDVAGLDDLAKKIAMHVVAVKPQYVILSFIPHLCGQ